VTKAAAVLDGHRFPIGVPEKWDGEGTLEIYVGDKTQRSLLLLMEPIKTGAYSRAMEKRGPGLHHVAIDVLDLEIFIERISGSGWLLHPKSLHTIKKMGTAYLARPGTPLLVEVQQREEIPSKQPFITQIKIPLSQRDVEMLNAIGVNEFENSQSTDSWIQFGETRVTFEALGIVKKVL